jgi:hypothetical protein
MRKTNLRQLLSFKVGKGPGYEISPRFYLSVMASQMPLPSIRDVIEPKGSGGAIVGFGVPMKGEKSDLDRPMERGAYVVASLDRKTLIRCLVVSKEEAGFSPDAFLRSDLALALGEEAQARMRATWTLMQLTFESYDPAVHPAVRLMYAVADRMALLSGGLVADPVSQVYKMPGSLLSDVPAEGFAIQDFVAIQSAAHGDQFGLYTLGMQKFGLPEFEIWGVDESMAQSAARLLLGLGQGVLRGKPLNAGDSVGSKLAAFRLAEGGLDRGRWEGVSVLEVLCEENEDINAVLARWESEER